MPCCTLNIIPFSNEIITTIAYSGNKPTVSVIYLQDDNSFLLAGLFTKINITESNIIIDHGGPSNGLVKLLV